uniref:Uncharacterized protein n=1 Tax=Glossina pallidipes TaxID=7398 RepID=A0A1B0A9D2_GLOPL
MPVSSNSSSIVSKATKVRSHFSPGSQAPVKKTTTYSWSLIKFVKISSSPRVSPSNVSDELASQAIHPLSLDRHRKHEVCHAQIRPSRRFSFDVQNNTTKLSMLLIKVAKVFGVTSSITSSSSPEVKKISSTTELKQAACIYEKLNKQNKEKNAVVILFLRNEAAQTTMEKRTLLRAEIYYQALKTIYLQITSTVTFEGNVSLLCLTTRVQI